MKPHKTMAEQHADKCIHFNGLINKKCEAGIAYPDDWRKNPCHKSSGLSCKKQRFPTEEETKIFIEETEKHFEGMRKAFQLVSKIKKEHKGEGWSGIEVCPVCGGKLHLAHAAFNGHVWGKCETEKCLAWME